MVEQEAIEPINPDLLQAVVSIELKALGELVDGNLNDAGGSLDEAARHIDTMLTGAGRMRLRYKPRTTAECVHFVLDMVPYQIDAIRLCHEGNTMDAATRIHGHASALWKIAAYLFEAASGASAEAGALIAEPSSPQDDERRSYIVEKLDELLDGIENYAIFEESDHHQYVRFIKRREQLLLDFPIAQLDYARRQRALAFFQRLEKHMGDWDEVSLSDEEFAFQLEMGINLDKCARLTTDIFREVLGARSSTTISGRLA